MIDNKDLIILKRKIKEIITDTDELISLLSQTLVVDDKNFGQKELDYIKKIENEILINYTNDVVKPIKNQK